MLNLRTGEGRLIRGGGSLITMSRSVTIALTLLAACSPLARAAEHITLRNGFELDCARRESIPADRVRLYLLSATASDATNYIEVPAASILRTETIPDPPVRLQEAKPGPTPIPALSLASNASPTSSELRELLAHAGTLHNIDADLLASVVHAESNGNARAVSHAGAKGLMQLMPGTAADLGVTNAFVPSQNIDGGSSYLDSLLTRYHDNIALALAAYNAGPLAVDRYRGIPPYAETRAYVARVIREFNRRKLAAATQLATK